MFSRNSMRRLWVWSSHQFFGIAIRKNDQTSLVTIGPAHAAKRQAVSSLPQLRYCSRQSRRYIMADQSPAHRASKKRRLTDRGLCIPASQDDTTDVDGHRPQSAARGPQPELFHKLRTQRSILALVIADTRIYAGTQGGDILVLDPGQQKESYLTLRLGLVARNIRTSCHNSSPPG